MNAVIIEQRCGCCRKPKPWTSENFDEKANGALLKTCRECMNKYFRVATRKPRVLPYRPRGRVDPEKLADLCATHTRRELARHFHVTLQSIDHHLARLNLEARPDTLGPKGPMNQRTTPRRLVRIQPNMLDWPEWLP